MTPMTKVALIEEITQLTRRPQPELRLLKAKPLRQILKDELVKQTCRGCGQRLTVLVWNSRVDILICGNIFCSEWHKPAGGLKK